MVSLRIFSAMLWMTQGANPNLETMGSESLIAEFLGGSMQIASKRYKTR